MRKFKESLGLTSKSYTPQNMKILMEVKDFIGRYHLSKLNKNSVNKLNSPKVPKKIEAISKIIPTKTWPRPQDFSAEFNQTLKEELIPRFLKPFYKIKIKRTLANLFYETTVSLIPIPLKDQILWTLIKSTQ